MSNAGRKQENLYDKWIKGKEDVIIAACRNGAIVDDLIRIIGCGKTTFHQIKKEHLEFSELLKSGREVADLAVENALYKRALGFEYEETTNEVRMGKDGSLGEIISVKKTKKIIPPDVVAQIFWLKNRKSNEWRDKQDLSITDNSYIAALEALSDKYKAENEKQGNANTHK